MKTILIYVLCLLCYTTSFAQESDNDLVGFDLEGKVKSLTSKTYRSTMKDGKVKLLSVSAEQTQKFNKDGYLTYHRYRLHTRTFGTGKWRETVYVLNAKNQVTKESYLEDSVLIEYSKKSYKDDLVTESVHYDGEGNMVVSVVFSYNKKGKMTEKLVMNADKSTRSKITFAYDDKDRLVEQKSWTGEVLDRTIKKEYLSDQKIKTIQTKGAGDWYSTDLEVYNEKEELLFSESYDEEGKVSSKSTNEYDEHGNQSLRQRFNDKGEEETYNYVKYKYRYDDTKNWIQKVEFLYNGNSLDAIGREIEYYK